MKDAIVEYTIFFIVQIVVLAVCLPSGIIFKDVLGYASISAMFMNAIYKLSMKLNDVISNQNEIMDKLNKMDK